MELTNPVSSFVANNPWMVAGPHMRCIGTGLIALWKKEPASALRIGSSIMHASCSQSRHFLGALCYIEGDAGGDGEAEVMFRTVLGAYRKKPFDDTRLVSIEWTDLYNHRTALSRFVEMACSAADGKTTLDEWGE